MLRFLPPIGFASVLSIVSICAVSQTASAAEKATPLRERDKIAVQVIFTYGDSHTKSLSNGSSIHFDSNRSGTFEATLDRYRAYAGVDSFKLDSAGKGNISVGDDMIVRTGGGSVTRREEGSGQPRSEEHTSELQSPCNLVCRRLVETKLRKAIWT